MTVESAVLRVKCPVDGCDAEIPLRADVEWVDDKHAVLAFTSTAVRAHVLLSHREEAQQCQ